MSEGRVSDNRTYNGFEVGLLPITKQIVEYRAIQSEKGDDVQDGGPKSVS